MQILSKPTSKGGPILPLRRRSGPSLSTSFHRRFLLVGAAAVIACCAFLTFTDFPFTSTSASTSEEDEEEGMRIAVIAWGSLAWQFTQPGREKLHVIGDIERHPGYEETSSFQPGGPSLPLEFSRVSLDGRLTLVITPDSAPQETFFATHESSDLQQAIENVKRREMPITDDKAETSFQKKAVGYIDIKRNKYRSHSYEVQSIMKEWCLQNNFDAAIWWDGPSNFEEKKGTKFTLKDGVKHLYSLKGETRESALEYIRNSPINTGSGIKSLVMKSFG